jgi:WD40 domain-containing protein
MHLGLAGQWNENRFPRVRSSRVLSFLACLGFLVVPTPFCHGKDEKKSSLPSAAEQARIDTLLRELYGKEIDRAKSDRSARVQLAARFLLEGRDTHDDLAGRYVLFRMARDLAAAAGDVTTALQAIDEMAQDFAITPEQALRMKIDALNEAAKVPAAPDAHQRLVDAALVLAQEALDADDYGAGLRLLGAADAAAIKLKNVALVSSIRKRRHEAEAAQKEYARWQLFADALRKDPHDPKANLEMGRYMAFVKGNWERGLPLLARGSDDGLKQLAAADLADPKEAGEQSTVANRWSKVAAAEKGVMSIHIQLHAYQWYVQALAGLEGEARDRVERQMAAINKQLPPEYRIGEIGREMRKIDVHGGPMYAVACLPDSRRVIIGGADKLLHVYDVVNGKEAHRFDGHAGRIWAVACTANGRYLASAGFDNTIRLWNSAGGREKHILSGHTDYVRSLAFSRDGSRLLSGGDDRALRLWNTATGKEIRSMTGHDHCVWSVAVSPDGRRALSGSLDRTLRLWDVETGRELLKLAGHADTILSVALSPDGRRALSGSTDKTLKLWDLKTGREIMTLRGHTGYVHGVTFSPDGRRALSAGQDHTVRLWDVFTGKLLRVLEGHTDQVWSVAFGPNGRLAVSAGQDGTIRIWGKQANGQAVGQSR